MYIVNIQLISSIIVFNLILHLNFFAILAHLQILQTLRDPYRHVSDFHYILHYCNQHHDLLHLIMILISSSSCSSSPPHHDPFSISHYDFLLHLIMFLFSFSSWSSSRAKTPPPPPGWGKGPSGPPPPPPVPPRPRLQCRPSSQNCYVVSRNTLENNFFL